MVSVPWVMTTPSTSGIASELVDAAGQLQPDLVVHVLRADVRDLLAAQRRELLRLRHGGEQLVDADLARGVAGLHVARGGAGDGAAGGEHDDVRELVRGRARGRAEQQRRATSADPRESDRVRVMTNLLECDVRSLIGSPASARAIPTTRYTTRLKAVVSAPSR